MANPQRGLKVAMNKKAPDDSVRGLHIFEKELTFVERLVRNS